MIKSTLLKIIVILSICLFGMPLKASNLPEKLLNMPIKLTNGKTVSLADYQSKKPVYLKFWATWCQPCRKEMPHFQHVQNEFGDQVEVIAINLGINDNIEAVEATQKEFALTMPMAIDNNGDLAQAFRLLGTPYHLLFDKEMNLLHVGNEANKQLDNKIALVSQQKTIDLLDIEQIAETSQDVKLNLNDGKTHVIYFTATWCDWYLKDSRPSVSQDCISSQKFVNQLAKDFPKVSMHGLVSRLWTGDKELAKYQKKHQANINFSVDFSNRFFHQFNVKDLGTLVIVRNGKMLLKASPASDIEMIKKQLREL